MKKIGRQVNFIGTSEFNQRNGEGSFAKLKNGKIIFGFTEFTTNDWEDDVEARIAYILSDDNGETWSDKKVLFEKYGFMITDSSISEFDVEETIADFFENERVAAVRRSIECSTADARLEAEKDLAEQEIKELEEANRKTEAKIRLQAEIKEKQIESNRHVEEMSEAAAYAKKQAESALQALIDEISAAELARKDREIQQQIEHTKAAAKIEAEKQKNYADMVKVIISATLTHTVVKCIPLKQLIVSLPFATAEGSFVYIRILINYISTV